MNKGIYGFCFVLGLACGTAGGYYLAKKKYEKLADEEVESVIDAFNKGLKVDASKHEDPVVTEVEHVTEEQKKSVLDKPDLSKIREELKAKNIISKEQYVSDEDEKLTEEDVIVSEEAYTEDEVEEEEDDDTWPEDKDNELIDSFAFGSENRETITMIFYEGDHILAYEDNTVMQSDSIDKFIGKEFLKEFDNESKDAIYVRNYRLAIDYEILKDHRKYSEVMIKRL